MAIRHDPVDVVTVGAGLTAAIVAARLTRAGRRVVSLERGGAQWTYPDFAHNHDHLRYAIRSEMMQDLAQESWTWRPDPRLPSLPMRRYGAFHPGQGVGGSMVHWTAMLWRFQPSDFQIRTRNVERYGAAKLPAGNRLRDWPVTYAELEPYYDAFEYDIGASGRAGNLNGTILPGGNPFEGPRARPFPLPPLAPSIPAQMFERAATEAGYRPFPMPAGILSQAYRDVSGRWRSGCLYCGYCTRYGCEVDAKFSPITTHLPMALETGRYEVRPECTVLRIETAADGRATGVTYLDAAGREHFQPAEVVLLSAYTLSNARLLLLSRSRAHPNGLGNARAQVGQDFTYQTWKTPATGTFEGRRFNLYMGNGATQSVLYEFYGDNFDHGPLDFIGGAQLFCGGGERDPLMSVQDVPPMSPNAGEGGVDDAWGAAWKARMKQWDSFFPITIQGDSLPFTGQTLDLDPTYTDRLGRPLLRLTFDFSDNDRAMYRFLAQRCAELMRRMNPTRTTVSAELEPFNIHEYNSTHITGGCTMGTSPAHSVTNKYGQLWDAPNVFVTGAALFPHNPGSNPSGTVAALTYMAAEALATRYFSDPGQLLG